MLKELSEKKQEEIVKQFIIAIGDNPKREGLIDTPKRIVKMWKELYIGYNIDLFPKITTFHNGKDGIVYDELIEDEGNFYSQCEHHGVTFFGRYHFAYLPHKKGKLLGLSKVGRIVDFYSSRLQIQERLTHQIINHIWKELSKNTKYKPLGMGLVLEAEHLCKSMRGVKKKGLMRTTKLLGVMKTDPSTREEFMGWVNKNGKQ